MLSLAILTALVSVLSSWVNVALVAYFFESGDKLWGAFSLVLIVISTLVNLIICRLDHPEAARFAFWALVALLQVKGAYDPFEPVFAHTNISIDTENEFRAKQFIATVFQALPISALLAYILALDLHGRLREHWLAGALLLTFLTFSLGTTQYTAANDSRKVWLAALIQVLSQFGFRFGIQFHFIHSS
eukprot:c12237_g1_i2.p1 GENE.c12237_g1_i2~~c12237_g1_i2.p1  ORF type:complete len:203 (+),score=33.87 c12237_g1_i2:46-609(+)